MPANRCHATTALSRRGAALTSLLLTMASAAAYAEHAPAAPAAYIELLWNKTPEGAVARQETHSFVLAGHVGHQVCVAILDDRIAVSSVQLQLLDEAGTEVARSSHVQQDGSKKCHAAELPAGATPGQWTYRVSVNGDGRVIGERQLSVHADLDALIASTPADSPYVLGRPNYDPSIPPASYKGELVWIMHIDAEGRVGQVDIEKAEGIGERMRPRAIAAGKISLFAPDPRRQATATYRRVLKFRPDN